MQRIEKFSRAELIRRIAETIERKKISYNMNRLRLAPDELLRDFLMKTNKGHYYKSFK